MVNDFFLGMNPSGKDTFELHKRNRGVLYSYEKTQDLRKEEDCGVKGKILKTIVGILMAFASIVPANLVTVFAAEPSIIIDDTQTSGIHHFTYTEAFDASGSKGWAADMKDGIQGNHEAKTQHWVWNTDNTEASKHTYTFTFVGTGVQLWGVKNDNTNTFQLDNEKVEETTITGSAFTPVMLYEKQDITYGEHTVKVTLPNDGKHTGLQISYAKVFGIQEDTNVASKITPDMRDQDMNSFHYASKEGKKWTTGHDEAYIDLGIDGTDAQQCFYEIPFYGNGIEIFVNQGRNEGRVQYSVDDENIIIFDLYNSSRTSPVSAYKVENLKEGAHTLKAVLLPEKNEASSAIVNQVAYATIYHAPYIVKDIILEQTNYQLISGAVQKINYTVTPNYAVLDDITYTSNHPEIASVSKDGNITAHSAGSAQITIQSDKANIVKTITIQVEDAVPQLGGTIVEPYTQFTQNRYAEVKSMGMMSKELTAWINDKAVSEISLYSKDSELKNVTVSASDFTDQNHKIAASNISTTFIKSTKAYNGSYLGYGSRDREIPAPNENNRSESNDILYQSAPIDVGFNKLQNVWVEINIPKEAVPGTYHGVIYVSADGIEQPLSFQYTLTVQNAVLKDASEFKNSFDIELWQYPYSSAEYYGVTPFSEEHFNILKSNMELYKEIGGHAITTTIVEDAWNGQTYSKNDVHYPSMVKWTKNPDGSFTYDFTDFDKWVSFNKALGIGDKIVLYSIAPWHNSFTYWENDKLVYEPYTVGSTRYKEVWTDFLNHLISHLTSKGWFNDSYIGIDERGFSKAAFDLIDSVKNIHDQPLKTAGAMDGFINKPDLALRVSDLNVGDTAAAEHPEEFQELLKKRNEANEKTTLYSCTEHQPGNFSLSAPVESYWSIINAGKQNTSGFLRWAYDAWVENPLEDATHNSFEPGDCFSIYPDEKDAKNPQSKPSVRFEMFADGIRDVNKLKMMEDEIPSLRNDINALYDNITIQAKTSRSYLSKNDVELLSKEVINFKMGLADLTERYLLLKESGTDKVESIEISESDQELNIGTSKQLHAIVLPKNLLNTNVKWSSSNDEVVSVSQNGTISAKKLGKATINVTSIQDPAKTDHIIITVIAGQIDEASKVSYYSFDDMQNGIVKDMWGHRDGKSLGAGLGEGKSNQALYISEAEKGVVFDQTSSIGENDPWTISYWIKDTAPMNTQISEFMDRDKNFAFSMKMASDRDAGFRIGKGAGDVLTFKYPFEENKWYNITWTQSKTDGLSMYVNGSLVENNAWTKTKKILAPLDIIGGSGFTGYIDELKVYNKVLTSTEIASSMMVNGLNISEQHKTLYINDTYAIETNLISDQDDKTITYTSNHPEIASVDKEGVVSAKSKGDAEITVENKAGGFKEIVTISVQKKLNIANKLPQYQLPEDHLSTIEKDEGTNRQYLGQPDMVRFDDGTLLTAYPIGHGKGPIVLKTSKDNGNTWSENTNTPKSWEQSQETPTMYILKLADGIQRVMLITACPGWGDGSTGWNTSYSDDEGKTWNEYQHWHSNHADGKSNKSIVGMASLIQLKDENGKDIQKWMGVYHDYDYINYRTYLTFDASGKEQWSEPEPYLSEYRDIEKTYQMCEIGMFRSPDGKRIVGIARSQSHNHPATLIYSDDEGKTWSKPMDLPGSLAGERHKAVYDPVSGRLLITFREINYDLNENNQFDGNSDWNAGDWVAWVGTYDDLMAQNEGQYRILLAQDWANNEKSGDTGYAGIVVLPDGTYIMDSYGHWDKDFSMSWQGGVTTDLCYIKQAKFKLSEMDQVAGLIDRSMIQKVIVDAKEIKTQGKYSDESWNILQKALKNAISIEEDAASTQNELDQAANTLQEALDNLKTMITIRVQSLDDHMGTVTGDGSYQQNDQVDVHAKVNTGYHFTGWQKDGKIISYQEDYSFAATKDMKLIALFEKDEVIPDKETTILTDEVNLINIRGAFMKGTQLSVKIYNHSQIDQLKGSIKNKDMMGHLMFEKVMNLSLINNGEKQLPEGNVSVTVTLTPAQMKKTLSVLSMNEQGEMKLLKSEIKDNKIVFETSQLGVFAIVSDAEEAKKPDQGKGNETPVNDEHKQTITPNTGDYTNANELALMIIISGAAIMFLVNKTRKHSTK